MEKAFAESSFHQLQQRAFFVEYELCVSLHWLSKLRWIAALVLSWEPDRPADVRIGLQPLPLYIIGASILVQSALSQPVAHPDSVQLHRHLGSTRNLRDACLCGLVGP